MSKVASPSRKSPISIENLMAATRRFDRLDLLDSNPYDRGRLRTHLELRDESFRNMRPQKQNKCLLKLLKRLKSREEEQRNIIGSSGMW
jgi:hypothetical protein